MRKTQMSVRSTAVDIRLPGGLISEKRDVIDASGELFKPTGITKIFRLSFCVSGKNVNEGV